jgi:MraZ protein
VSIPAGFRVELQRRSDRPPILTTGQHCLELHPHEDWIAREKFLAGLSSVDADTEAYRRFLLSGASECTIDAQGRLLIPPPLREHAELEREVVIAGVGEKVEIWNKARFDAEINYTRTNFREISSRVRPGS